jgi:type II secretory pathway component GspD/PulD (secretin)
MIKWLSLILLTLLLSGCETSQVSSESNYDRLSSEIDRLKDQAERSGIGDNIKIVVNMLSANASENFAIDSLLQYVDKNVSVTKNPQLMTTSGLKIGIADSNFRTRVDITKTQLKSSEETELFLLLADGTSGYINIGTEIAVPQFYYSNKWYSSVGYEFRRAGRSLKVTARKLPSGLVYMELTPVFSRFLSNGGDLELTELSTTVTVSPGQTLVIGGGDTATQNVATALLAYSKSGQKRNTLITVTPRTQ